MSADTRTYRLGCGAALVAGPALFYVDNVLHPEEFTRGHEAALLGLAYAVCGRLPRLGLGRSPEARFAPGRA